MTFPCEIPAAATTRPPLDDARPRRNHVPVVRHATLIAMALAASGAPAMAALPSASIGGWPNVGGAVFVRNEVVLATSSVLRYKAGFTVYETSAASVRLNGARTRFVSGGLSNRVIVRSSIAPMPGSRIASNARGFVLTPGGSTPPPVSWCCIGGLEVVLESDGRPGAPIAMGAGMDGDRVRALFRVADGSAELRSWSPQILAKPDDFDASATAVPVVANPGGSTTAIAEGIVTWSDAPSTGVLSWGIPADEGVADVRTVSVGGPILEVKADRGTAVVLARSGKAFRVLRVAADGRVTVAWRGNARPVFAAGQGTVAVGVARRVFASTTGPVRRVVSRTRGPIAAVGADGNRVLWVERITRTSVTTVKKRKVTTRERRSAVRLARVAVTR